MTRALLPSPLTSDAVQWLHAMHSQFAHNGLSGSLSLEIHYRAGQPMQIKFRGPELVLQLAGATT